MDYAERQLRRRRDGNRLTSEARMQAQPATDPGTSAGPELTTEVQPATERPAVDIPITPMVPAARPGDSRGSEPRNVGVSVPQMNYREMLALGNELYKTGFLPDHIKNGAQATAIILAGQEIGIPAMKSLRSIKLVKGQIVLNADLQLGLFKRRGGRAKFRELSDERAVLDLVHPNGDTHTEVFTMADAKRAGLLKRSPRNPDEPNSYEKFPRPMLRSRCITAGLKSIGFEELAGAYDPEEARHFDGSNVYAFVDEDETATETAGTADTTGDVSGSNGNGKPEPVVFRINGHALDEKHGADAGEKSGRYYHSVKALQAQYDWALDTAEKHDAEPDKAERFNKLAAGIQAELERRYAESEAIAEAARHSPEADAAVAQWVGEDDGKGHVFTEDEIRETFAENARAGGLNSVVALNLSGGRFFRDVREPGEEPEPTAETDGGAEPPATVGGEPEAP